LETIDVEEDQRQRAMVPRRAGQLAVEELHQVALVVDAGEGIDDGQAIDFFMVFRFDVAAGKEAIHTVADAQIIAVLHRAHGIVTRVSVIFSIHPKGKALIKTGPPASRRPLPPFSLPSWGGTKGRGGSGHSSVNPMS